MKFIAVVSIVSALFAQAALASPVEGRKVDIRDLTLEERDIARRTSCQVCSVKGFEAGPACCSASCLIQHGDFHGGHCDKNDYCICN